MRDILDEFCAYEEAGSSNGNYAVLAPSSPSPSDPSLASPPYYKDQASGEFQAPADPYQASGDPYQASGDPYQASGDPYQASGEF